MMNVMNLFVDFLEKLWHWIVQTFGNAWPNIVGAMIAGLVGVFTTYRSDKLTRCREAEKAAEESAKQANKEKKEAIKSFMSIMMSEEAFLRQVKEEARTWGRGVTTSMTTIANIDNELLRSRIAATFIPNLDLKYSEYIVKRDAFVNVICYHHQKGDEPKLDSAALGYSEGFNHVLNECKTLLK